MLTKLLPILSLLLTAANAVDCTDANKFDLTNLDYSAGFSAASDGFSWTPECPNIEVTIQDSVYLMIKRMLSKFQVLTVTETNDARVDVTQSVLTTPSGEPYQLTFILLASRRRLPQTPTTTSITTAVDSTGAAGTDYTLNIAIDFVAGDLIPTDFLIGGTAELIDVMGNPLFDLDASTGEKFTAINIQATSSSTPAITFESGKVYALDLSVDVAGDATTFQRSTQLQTVEFVTLTQGSSSSQCLSVLLGVTGTDTVDYTLTVTDCDCIALSNVYSGCCNGKDYYAYAPSVSGSLQACLDCYPGSFDATTCANALCNNGGLDPDVSQCCKVESNGGQGGSMYTNEYDATELNCCLNGGTTTSTKTCEEACKDDITLCPDRTSLVEGCCIASYGSSKSTECGCNCPSGGANAYGTPEFVADQGISANNELCIVACIGLDDVTRGCCTDLNGAQSEGTHYECCVVNEADTGFDANSCANQCSYVSNPTGCCEYVVDSAANPVTTTTETLTKEECCSKEQGAFDEDYDCAHPCNTLDETTTACCSYNDPYGGATTGKRSYDALVSSCCSNPSNSVDANGDTCAEACRKVETSCTSPATPETLGCCIEYSTVSAVTECVCLCDKQSAEFVAEGTTSSLSGYTCGDVDCIDVGDETGCCTIGGVESYGTEHECCLATGSAPYSFTLGECAQPCVFTSDELGCCTETDGSVTTLTDRTEAECCTNNGVFDAEFLCDDVCRDPAKDNAVCCESVYYGTIRSSDQTSEWCCNQGGSQSDQSCAEDCRASLGSLCDSTVTSTGCCNRNGAITEERQCDCMCANAGSSLSTPTFTADGGDGCKIGCIGKDDTDTYALCCTISGNADADMTDYDCCMEDGVFGSARCPVADPCEGMDDSIIGCCGAGISLTRKGCCGRDPSYSFTEVGSEDSTKRCCTDDGTFSSTSCEDDCKVTNTALCTSTIATVGCCERNGAQTEETECECTCANAGTSLYISSTFTPAGATGCECAGKDNVNGQCCTSIPGGVDSDLTDYECCKRGGTFGTAPCPDPDPCSELADIAGCCVDANTLSTTAGTDQVCCTQYGIGNYEWKAQGSENSEGKCCTAQGVFETSGCTTATCEDNCAAAAETGCCDRNNVITEETECNCNCDSTSEYTAVGSENGQGLCCTSDGTTVDITGSQCTSTVVGDTTAGPTRCDGTSNDEGDYCCTDTEGDETDITDTEYGVCTACGDGTYTEGTCCENDNSISSVLSCLDLECETEPYLTMVLELDVCSNNGMENAREELFGIIKNCVAATANGHGNSLYAVTSLSVRILYFLLDVREERGGTTASTICTAADNGRGYTFRFGLSLCGEECETLTTIMEYIIKISKEVAETEIDECVLAATKEGWNKNGLENIGGEFTVATIGDCNNIFSSGSGVAMMYPSLMVFVLGFIATLFM